MKVLVTGGAGFIGSAVVRHLIRNTDAEVVVVDALTYAATPEAMEDASDSNRYAFEKADIRDEAAITAIFEKHQPNRVMHLAAESHVDRSIDGPMVFIDTNVVGTANMLQIARKHWDAMPNAEKEAFRFHHISTDEVYGSLEIDDAPFTEETAYAPNSPYAASKAASDHLVRAWGKTYGLPVVTSNCSNNYGPWQFPEKLIPVIVLKAKDGEKLPIYGKGDNIRDWLFVDDHARALATVVERGAPGETYNIGGDEELTNLDLVHKLCGIMDEYFPDHAPHAELIEFVTDRPGHDQRYAIDPAKTTRELGWRPQENLDSGMRKTVKWYLDNEAWWRGIRAGTYGGERLGSASKKG